MSGRHARCASPQSLATRSRLVWGEAFPRPGAEPEAAEEIGGTIGDSQGLPLADPRRSAVRAQYRPSEAPLSRRLSFLAGVRRLPPAGESSGRVLPARNRRARGEMKETEQRGALLWDLLDAGYTINDAVDACYDGGQTNSGPGLDLDDAVKDRTQGCAANHERTRARPG